MLEEGEWVDKDEQEVIRLYKIAADKKYERASALKYLLGKNGKWIHEYINNIEQT